MLAQQAPLLPLPVLLLLVFALVVALAAPGERELDLRPAAAVEIDAQWHERHALPGDRAMQPRNLALVEQQLAAAPGIMVEAVAMAELGDVGVDQPHLFVVDLGIALRDRSLAEAQRLHLGPGERDTRLVAVLDDVIEARAPILGDGLLLVEGLGLGTRHRPCR